MNIAVELIILLAKEKGVSHAHLARKMNTYRTKISEWRNNKSTPTEEEIAICAIELGTSIEYLSGKSDDSTPLNAKQADISLDEIEFALLDEVRELDDEDKEELLKNARRFREFKELKKLRERNDKV